jgi:hypothetical protein
VKTGGCCFLVALWVDIVDIEMLLIRELKMMKMTALRIHAGVWMEMDLAANLMFQTLLHAQKCLMTKEQDLQV